MKIPISWLKEFVNITLSTEELAERLTLAGLEVGSIRYVGLKGADLEWDREKLVLGQIIKVEQHPAADRLVLATVDIGKDEPETVVTGAPNLFEFIGQGDISSLELKSPFVMEGATVYDGHAKEPGKKMKLKGRKIRGIMNRHMLCSEKELGLSDEHEGIIIATGETAPPGTPLVEIWGDAVLDIDITPNMIRAASILGTAREIAALTGQKWRYPNTTILVPVTKIDDKEWLVIETTEPELNPRFVAILIKNITVKPSPYYIQRRLKMVGMRPINNIVDTSNYVMLEIGEPNHVFDWDVLRRRADEYTGQYNPVKIITRLAKEGEEVITLDGKSHKMPDFSMLVTDPKSNLSIGGVMGGGESEVSNKTVNILIEAAAWNFINIRRTTQALGIYSEAAYRFSRGIHSEQAMFGALRGAKLIIDLAGGIIGRDIFDYYPNKPEAVVIDLPQAEVTRLLGLELSLTEIKNILESLDFQVEETDETSLRVTVPEYRLDISTEPTIGRADLIEEIARIYGYDRIPVSEIADELPPQRNNTHFEREEKARDLLAQAGLQEVITYRLNSPENEARILGDDYAENADYVTLANPSTPERVVMRHSLLNSVLEVTAENSKHNSRVSVFEIGHIYLNNHPAAQEELPAELRRLVIVMTGQREESSWLPADSTPLDFFDIKGVVESTVAGLYIDNITFTSAQHPAYYPGRVAALNVAGQEIGLLGQLHPLTVTAYGLQIEDDWPVLAADFDLDLLLANVPDGHTVQSISRFPAIQQDIAIVVDENIPADKVKGLIKQTGRPLLAGITLFDIYRNDEQIGVGKKSLAYNLTYQSAERTLTDKVVAKQHRKIVQRLERELGAKLRS